MEPFISFPKMGRWSREVVVTEKIDGTNGQILIEQDGSFLVGSRTRWIVPGDDNFGFAAWAMKNKEILVSVLGPGRHYGEWWGSGIQRGYGLLKGERRFSLFNVQRWGNEETRKALEGLEIGIGVVPELWRGMMDEINIPAIMLLLKSHGSFAVPFMNPEGIVVYHTAAGVGFKKTFEKDEKGKWE